MQGRNPSADLSGRNSRETVNPSPSRSALTGVWGAAPNCKATSCFTAVLLEIGGRTVAERRLKPFPVVDPFQKLLDAGVGLMEIPVFVTLNLRLLQGFDKGFTSRVVVYIAGVSYDANGNPTSLGSYDVENRLVSSGQEEYAYGPHNERVWRRYFDGSAYQEELYFYGADGRKLATFPVGTQLGLVYKHSQVYFGGKLIRVEGKTVVVDRLGSVRATRGSTIERFDYYPYGEEKPEATAQGREKFGTYYRDNTGLDYAMNRYYHSGHGRFVTPDPYRASGGVEDPQSWNRYAYVQGDPVTYNDPNGLDYTIPDPTLFDPTDPRNVMPGHSSITVGTDDWTIDPGYVVSIGQIGGGWGGPSVTYVGFQSSYESGACVTADGRPCYEIDLAHRLEEQEQQRRKYLDECIKGVEAEARQKRQQWTNGRSTRLNQAIGSAIVTGAFYGAINGSIGGLVLSGVPGGVGGAVFGSVVGIVVDVGSTVITKFWVQEGLATLGWEIGQVRPILNAGQMDCEKRYGHP